MTVSDAAPIRLTLAGTSVLQDSPFLNTKEHAIYNDSILDFMLSSNREQISDSNKGFQLLKKAGWVEGTGLGVNKQGRTTPLNAWRNQGRSGIGCKKPKTRTPNPKQNPKSKPNSNVKRKSKAVLKTCVLRTLLIVDCIA